MTFKNFGQSITVSAVFREPELVWEDFFALLLLLL